MVVIIYMAWLILALLKLLKLISINWFMVLILPFIPYIIFYFGIWVLMKLSFKLSKFFKFLAEKVDDYE